MSKKMKKQHKQILGFIITLVFFSSISLIGELMPPNAAGSFDDNEVDARILHLADQPFRESLIVGTENNPVYLEPLNCWDYATSDIVRQTVEGLFMLNYSDEDLPRIPILAVDDGTWSDDTTWTVDLRQGVKFHDGTPFNAAAVKWNFDRLNWFLNTTGNITNGTASSTASLFVFNTTTPIIKNVTIESEYQVTFYLNEPFSPLLDLLTFIPCYILSPSSTPAYQFIDTLTGDIVGTGPYIYDSYAANMEVRFHRWDQYWRTPAQIEYLKFSIIQDDWSRNNAMLNGTIDILQGETESLLPTFRADPDITVDDVGPGLEYWYLGMNNEQINATMREAISYAINYTHIAEELLDGHATRAYSPLTPIFFPGWNQSTELNSPAFNVTYARKVLVDAGLSSLMLDDDAGWQAATLATYNYSYDSDNQFRNDLYPMLRDNLDAIGIVVEDCPMTWVEYISLAYGFMGSEGYDRLQLYWAGWPDDYLDPWQMLDSLFNNASRHNSAQVNDPLIQNMLTSALSEIDDAKRTEIYKQILSNLTGRIFPHVFGYHPDVHDLYSNRLYGYPNNVLNALYIYPCYWEIIPTPPGDDPIIIIIIIIIVIGSTITISTGSMYVYRESIVSKKRPDKYNKKKKMGSIGKETHKALPGSLSEKQSKMMSTETVAKKIPTETEAKKKPKVKKDAKLKAALVSGVLSEQEKKELKQTESEVNIQKEQFTCIVHRGAIVGTVYICPHCQTIYCQKCARVLKENGEKCWSCENDIELGDIKTKIESDPIDNSKLYDLFDGENIIEKISEPRGINVTLLSEDFFKKLEQLDWEDADKQEFIKEMLTLTPEKRERILDEMIEKSRIDE